MSNVNVMIRCGGSGLVSDTPGFVVLGINANMIGRIERLAGLVSKESLSEVRFTLTDYDYPDGDYDTGLSEMVITDGGLWVSTLFSTLEEMAPVDSESVSIDDLKQACEDYQPGDLVILGDNSEDLLTDAAENCEDWGLDKMPIGYQVSHSETGDMWGDLESYEIQSFAAACSALLEARKSGPGWERVTIYPDTIEDPFPV